MTDPTLPLSPLPDDAIAAIFAADPLTLSDTQLSTLVIELRRRRSAFLSAEAAAASKPKAQRAKPQPSTPTSAASVDKPLGELSLDDLE